MALLFILIHESHILPVLDTCCFCVCFAWAVFSLIFQVRGLVRLWGTFPPPPEAKRFLRGWPYCPGGGVHHPSTPPNSLATRAFRRLTCPESVRWASTMGLLWQLLEKQYLLSTRVAKLVTEKLGELLLSMKSNQNKTEQRDGERNIPEGSVGVFQSSCAQRLIPGLFSYVNQYSLHFCLSLFELSTLSISEDVVLYPSYCTSMESRLLFICSVFHSFK